MFTGTMIDDLVATVAMAEANIATKWRMQEEIENVPAFMLSRFENVNTRQSVLLGVA